MQKRSFSDVKSEEAQSHKKPGLASSMTYGQHDFSWTSPSLPSTEKKDLLRRKSPLECKEGMLKSMLKRVDTLQNLLDQLKAVSQQQQLQINTLKKSLNIE
ncbi:hypothetical protein EIN_345890 [Entamoeba invadens IP1]|uniref:Uncharacterized protein n=1 Tax=Entamoeba invadens IP1 TaxID=370355 RepID=L7FJV2_ENTIV|nr:hypothetical protein EIN_345890 [Entamoeba invadens IP1]ELP84003.1 hypothetical protein EIN_345890 [Entamoeba invadens IP1]|eukprot:XP_004183349.1 hypothetical protein EIN_345890 [Entamoeba invadens IP1]